MIDIRLRSAGVSDLEEIYGLYEAEQWTNFSKEKITRILEADASHYLVLVNDDDKIIGFIRYITDEVETTFVAELIVNKSYRRKGFGTRLVQEVFKRYPACRLELVSEQDSFYEKIGFVPIGSGLRLRK